MSPEDKLELQVRRAVGLANELVPYQAVPEYFYSTLWTAVFYAMVQPTQPQQNPNDSSTPPVVD